MDCILSNQTTMLKLTYSSSAERLHDFKVVVSDLSPDTNPPDPSDYTVCAEYTGPAPGGDIMPTSINCPNRPWGRYLIIQIPGDNEILTLCEVEVFLQRRSGKQSFLFFIRF